MSTAHISDPDGLGPRLKQARNECQLTMAELSFPGCTVAYISRIESGQRLPSLQIIQGLAERLGVSPHWLMTGKEDPLRRTAQRVVAEHRSGVQIPDSLIDRLDRLSKPS
jgi:transcriptional regulator with XRE-family HTH domain